MRKLLTLALFIKDDKILLGYKKQGFGSERWNGFGGKVEPGESLEEAAKREALEECGLQIQSLEKRAIHEFSFESNDDVLEVHTFLVTEWHGEPFETDEMRPEWFALKDIPYGAMWADDQFWLPQFLRGEYLRTRFHFGEGGCVLQYDIQIVEPNSLE